jgi:hypothetical protein
MSWIGGEEGAAVQSIVVLGRSRTGLLSGVGERP